MNAERLQRLKEFLAEEPDNAFLHYALALEYRNIQPEVAVNMLEEVIARFPDYLPALHTAALWKRDAGETAEAIQLLKRALVLAKRLGDSAALRELEHTLEDLTNDGFE